MANENDKRKQLEELDAGHALVAHLGFPKNCLENGLVPQPDLILSHTDGHKVGIEVTRLFDRTLSSQAVKSEPKRPPENMSDRIHDAEVSKLIVRSKELYMELGGLPLAVYVRCNKNTPNRRSRDKYATWIANWVFGNAPLVNRPSSCQWSDFIGNPQFPKCLSSIDVTRFPNQTAEHHWPVPLSYFASNSSWNAIEFAIQEKEKKLSGYVGDFSQRWLLMVSDFECGASSACVEWCEELEQLEFESTFDRLFMWNKLDGQVNELRRVDAG